MNMCLKKRRAREHAGPEIAKQKFLGNLFWSCNIIDYTAKNWLKSQDSLGNDSRTHDNSRGLDGPIRANKFADSRKSLDSRESFQAS